MVVIINSENFSYTVFMLRVMDGQGIHVSYSIYSSQ